MLESLILTLDPMVLVLAGLVLVVAGAVQGSTGFGFNLVAAPLLVLVDPVFVPAPMLLVAMVISGGAAVRERGQIDMHGLGYALLGRTICSVPAVLLLGSLTPQQFDLIFAVILIVAVSVSLSGWRVQPTRGNLFLAGGASGFMGTLTSVGAPPMALVYQNASGASMRATLSGFFVVGAAISLGFLWYYGFLGRLELQIAAFMLPCALIGLFLSNWGRNLFVGGRVKPIVLATTCFTAIVLIGRNLL